MSISIMSLLMIVGVSLLLIVTVLGVKTFMDTRRFWRDIEYKAAHSPIKGFDD